MTLRRNPTVHEAAAHGDVRSLQFLLRAGADINSTVLMPGEHSEFPYDVTPLHLACRFGHLSAVRYLTQKGADPLFDQNGQSLTPVHEAVANGHIDLLIYFAGIPIDLNLQARRTSETLLDWARSLGQENCAKFIEHWVQHRRIPKRKLRQRFQYWRRLRGPGKSFAGKPLERFEKGCALHQEAGDHGGVKVIPANDERHLQLVSDLPKWGDRSQTAAKELFHSGWEPQTDREIVLFWIARHATKKLRNFSMGAIAVLLGEMESRNPDRVQFATYAIVGLGWEWALSDLERCLKSHGTKQMAETFLNCGHPRLAKLAETWATQRGYSIRRGSGASTVRWGRL